MNIFTSKNKTFAEGCRSPSPLARITFGRQTRKKTRERQASDSVLSDAFESDSPNSSPSHSPVLSGKTDYFFNRSQSLRSQSLPLFKSKTDLRYAHIFDDGEKFCQGAKCKDASRKPAVKICHHTDCQEKNDMNPLLLCDDCDQSTHVGQAVCHLRFQLPKNFKRTASIRSTNSDSGNEDEAEQRHHFDKKNKGYASARKFFNINSSGNQGKKKVSKGKDPGRELLRVRFYEPGNANPHDSEVIPAVKGKSLKESMAPLFEARSIRFETHSVFLDASNTPLPLAFDIYRLGGNVLHVRAINDVDVDKRIIELARQSYNKDKESQYQKGKKNILYHFGDERMQSADYGRNAPQRRSGIYEVPNIRDVPRTFNDILDYYSANGIMDGKSENDDEFHLEKDLFFIEESWTLVIDHPPDFAKKSRDQQEAIWELLTTEANYLKKLHLIHKIFLRSLRSLQNEGHLQEIDIGQLFGNISQVWDANLSFWSSCLKPVVEKARKDRDVISPTVFREGFAKFGTIMQPYRDYCLNEAQCLQYLKNNRAENEKFKTYLSWCEDHTLCNRLKLTDLLVKPMQRLTKYPLLIKAIVKKTQDLNEKPIVQEMFQNAESFVVYVNSALRIRHEQKKTQTVVERLDTYMPVDPVNDEVEKMLMDFTTLELNRSVPFLSATEHRCVLMEGAMKLVEKQNRADVYCFLFTDIFLITKGKRSNEKFKILKQPFRLNKVIIKPLKESGGFLFVYLNEYGSLVTAFVLQAPPIETTKWMHTIEKAKQRYNRARSGHGSTYEFFDDDLNTSFAFASPHHSPNQERRPSWQQKFAHSPHVDLQPSIIVTEQFFEQRKPRSYSIEPRRVTSPHVEMSKLSESFDNGNKVTRSVSDSKKEKVEPSRPLESVPYWQENRPASMIGPSKGMNDISSFVMNEQRSRSDSLGSESPADDPETCRNESFRSTSSDTILTRSDLLRNEIRRQIKPSSSAPEVSKGTSSVQRRHSDGASDSRYSRHSMHSREPRSISVSSSNTSISTERGALSRDNSFKNRDRDITELDEGSHDESAMGRSTPSFFLELEDNTDLKESTVDDITSARFFVDQDCQTDVLALYSEVDCQTEDAVSKVDSEVQTDVELERSGTCNERTDVEETAIQCDLIQRVFDCSDASHHHHAINFQRAAASNSDEPRRSWTNIYQRSASLGERAYSLRGCHSEIDLRKSQVYGIHYRSLSEDCNLEMATDANGNHESPVIRKRTSSDGQLSPGMLALQSLSNSLESSIQPKVPSGFEKETFAQKKQCSPLSLRRVALLNSSPVSKRKEKKTEGKGTGKRLLPIPSKRNTWHADSVTELEKLEKELFCGSKDDLSMAIGSNDVRSKDDEKPKRPERKKYKGKKKDEKKKKKKDAEFHGVVSGPNMDKRKAHRVLLENSLMHGKPELV